MKPDAPIGIFDSGIGGLSVLRHIRAYLPHEHLLYFADSGFAPYGDKPDDVIIARTLAVADFFMQSGIKSLVVACNTATAAAIQTLRRHYPKLLLIGVEPALKPAALQTKTGTVGVLATDSTLASKKFTLLQEQVNLATNVRFLLQPCIGLADQIEKGELHSSVTALLIRRYVEPLIRQDADVLVLGCTHYPFVKPMIEKIAKEMHQQSVMLIDTGEAVARQLVRILDQEGLTCVAGEGCLHSFTTGSITTLKRAFAMLLQLTPTVTQVSASGNFHFI
jgi:glutamate racemase